VSDLIQSLADAIPSHLRKRVERELINGWRMKEVNARKVAKQSAAFNHANEAHSIEGVGQLSARIPMDAWHYWGQRLGYECWEDKQFFNDFKKHNPEVAVRNYAKKTVVNGAIFTADGFVTK
jgi:hypothetical protein